MDENDHLFKVLITVGMVTEHGRPFDKDYFEKTLAHSVTGAVDAALFRAGYRGISELHAEVSITKDVPL